MNTTDAMAIANLIPDAVADNCAEAEAAPMVTLVTETEPAKVRAFWPSDWKRMAREIRLMRSVKGDKYTPKPAEAMIMVDALATVTASAFAADAGDKFSPDKWLASTQLPAKPPVFNLMPEDSTLDAAGTEDAGEDEL